MKKRVGQVACVFLAGSLWAASGDGQAEKMAGKAQIKQEIAAQTKDTVRQAIEKYATGVSGLVLDKIGTGIEQELAVLGAQLAALGEQDPERQREMQERQREMQERVRERVREQAERVREMAERSDSYYEQGYRCLDEGRWEKAVELFDRVASAKSNRADGALYWKAYALDKQGQRDAALAALASLKSAYSSSRWINDANALEVEIKQRSGQPVRPESQSDDDLKLLALNSLMRSNPEIALPVLEKFLKGSQPPRLKEKALFVLAQNPSPKSREMLAQFARGQVNPDLQLKAVEYLGVYGGKENGQLLAEIYASSADLDVKKRILRSFMISGDRERLFNAAKSEQNADLRREAIRQLGVMGRGKRRGGGSEPLPGESDELWKLYQSESSADVKREILNALFIQGNAERVTEAARAEKDSTVRREAIRKLGIMRSSDTLASLYAGEKEYDLKREIINGLFIQGNAKGLVDIARKETDPNLKKEVVSKLGLMKNSKEATDYMMEILSK